MSANGRAVVARIVFNNRVVVTVDNGAGVWSDPEVVYTAQRACIMVPTISFDGLRLLLSWSEREILAGCINEDFAQNDDATSQVPSESSDPEADNQIIVHGV